MKKDVMLTTDDIVTIFGVSYATVRNWLGTPKDGKFSEGKFPNAYMDVSYGKHIYIPAKDVRAYLDKLRKAYCK